MKIQMTVAAVVTTAFVAAVAASNASTRNQTTGLLLIGTIAAGYIENLTLSSTAYLWDPADMGLVTGVMGAIRTGLSAIATSMYSSILSTESAKSLPALFAGITLGDFTKVPGISAEIIAATGAAVKDAYAMTFRTVYLCTLPFGALLIAAALFSPNVEQYLTDEVARKMHGREGVKTEIGHKEVVEEA
jgi:hypothetical protein